MKKIYMALIFVFCALCTVQTCSVTACAARSNTVEYDIQIESLDASSDAKELNKYRKAILKNLNRAARYWTPDGVETDFFTRLTLDDLDFTDSSKVTGMKPHDRYDDCESDISYEDFMRKTDTGNNGWVVFIDKNDTEYFFGISKISNTDVLSEAFVAEVGGGWYMTEYPQVIKIDTDFISQKYFLDREVIESNMKRLLKEEKEEHTDIKLVWTRIGVGQEPFIVFVDGKAKYIFDWGLDFPDCKKGTSKEVLDLYEEVSHELWKNFDDDDPLKVKSLYSYNLVMAMLRLCK